MEPINSDYTVMRLDETESTNSYLKQLLKTGRPEEGLVVVARYQLAGRGQRGNAWFASKGRNLLFSLLIYPTRVPANGQFVISRMVSLAVKNTLDRFTDGIRIKWPNDIYWNEHKIAGILIENDLEGKSISDSIIGIGINVNEENFPEELPNPVSLLQITGSEQDPDYILNLFLGEFFQLYHDFRRGEIKAIEDEYRMDLYRATGFHWYEDGAGRFMAEIADVLPSGHLVLRTMDGEERSYAFKEVAFAGGAEG